MRDVFENFLLAFIPIFVAIDPIGLIAIFMGMAPGAPREVRQRQGLIGIGTGFGISIAFIFLGQFIFKALGISVADFQVAGGLILLGLAGRELIGGEERVHSGSDEFGVVPLGMPGLNGLSKLIALLLAAIAVSLIRRGWQAPPGA